MNIFFGAVHIPGKEILTYLSGDAMNNQAWHTIISEIRIPEALTAVLAGGSLAISGLLMQTFFRNPLAGPSVLGLSSGAGLGVALVMLLSLSFRTGIQQFTGMGMSVLIIMAAIAGSMAVLFIILLAARRFSRSTTLLILGLMIAYLAGAIVSILQYMAEAEQLKAFVFWGLGSFSKVNMSQWYLLAIVLFPFWVLAVSLIKTLDVWLMGNEYAKSVGVNIKKKQLQIILCAGILAGGITAFCGPIAFLGLAVPHVARMIFKTSSHRILMPASILTGIALALLCNLLTGSLGDQVLPLNALTSLLGAPVIIWIIIKGNKMAIQT